MIDISPFFLYLRTNNTIFRLDKINIPKFQVISIREFQGANIQVSRKNYVSKKISFQEKNRLKRLDRSFGLRERERL